MPAKEATKIGGIVETKIRSDPRHRRGDINEAPSRLQRQPLLDDLESGGAELSTAQSIQCRLRQTETARIARHRPMRREVPLDQCAKSPDDGKIGVSAAHRRFV